MTEICFIFFSFPLYIIDFKYKYQETTRLHVRLHQTSPWITLWRHKFSSISHNFAEMSFKNPTCLAVEETCHADVFFHFHCLCILHRENTVRSNFLSTSTNIDEKIRWRIRRRRTMLLIVWYPKKCRWDIDWRRGQWNRFTIVSLIISHVMTIRFSHKKPKFHAISCNFV